jgi:hypothetical protein
MIGKKLARHAFDSSRTSIRRQQQPKKVLETSPQRSALRRAGQALHQLRFIATKNIAVDP